MPVTDTAQLQELQPLLLWLKQNAVRLRQSGKWPLRKEDVPPGLWALYSTHKSSLASLMASNSQQRIASGVTEGIYVPWLVIQLCSEHFPCRKFLNQEVVLETEVYKLRNAIGFHMSMKHF